MHIKIKWGLTLWSVYNAVIFVRNIVNDIFKQSTSLHQMPVRSTEKPGELYLPACSSAGGEGSGQYSPLYPQHVAPHLWASCGDAYEYTWMTDLSHDIAALSLRDRTKLSRSMGFCPHLRCQLTDLGNAHNDGHCPHNLCYTKLEQGTGSYGACCFRDGRFNSGNGHLLQLQLRSHSVSCCSHSSYGRSSHRLL